MGSSFGKSFLGLRLADVLGNNIAVWRGNVGVIILDGISDFKPKFLIKIDGVFIVCLHMQVDLRNVLLRTEIKNMVQQLCTCKNPRILINQTCKCQNIHCSKLWLAFP